MMDRKDIPEAIVAGILTALSGLPIVLLAMASLTSNVRGQEHQHGVNGIPDWYDSDCCNTRDCHPVEDGTIQFSTDYLGQPIVIHTYDVNQVPITYYRQQFRVSQDERFHVCYYQPDKTPYCIYLRAGM